MLLVHKIDDILQQLFPKINFNDHAALIKELEHYYSFHNFKPKISIKDEIVYIEVDVPRLTSAIKDFEKAVSLCEAEKFHSVLKLLLPCSNSVQSQIVSPRRSLLSLTLSSRINRRSVIL